MKTDFKSIARVFIEAFDMDIQIFLKNVLARLGETQVGHNIKKWSRSNPIQFNVLLRVISFSIQHIPQKNNNILLSTVKSQLTRLPAAVTGLIDEPEEEAFLNQDADNQDSFILSDGVGTLKGWTMANSDPMKPKTSLYEFLEVSSVMLYELGNSMNEGIEKSNQKNNFRDELADIFNNQASRKKMYEKIKESNPEMTHNEIIEGMNSDEFYEVQNLMIDTLLRFPQMMIDTSYDIERLHSRILLQIQGKSDRQALEIYSSEYAQNIKSSINSILQNDELDTEQKQKKIDRLFRLYEEIVKVGESFN